MTHTRRAALALTVALCAGCREEDIRVYDVPREAPPAAPTGLPAGHPPIGGARPPAGDGGGMGMGSLPAGAGEAAPRDVRWTVPAGWTEQPGAGMRVATLAIAAAGGKAEMSVIALPGTAGGTLANVNRWRGQMGLGEIGDAEFAKSSSRVASPAGEVVVVEFAGAAGKGSLFGGLLTAKGRTWFFKATGPAAVLAAARPDLLAFMKGLRAR